MSKSDKQEAMSSLAEGAQKLPGPHAPELRGQVGPPLAALHGHTVAVDLGAARDHQVLIGRGVFETNTGSASLLRVIISESPPLEFLIEETVFRGQILAGESHGCDYLLCVGVESPSSSPNSKRAGDEHCRR